MIDISLAGLIGAVVGIAIAGAVYGTVIDAVERWLASRRDPREQHLSEEVALLRRGVLAVDMLLFAGLGYWIGFKISGG
jgi:prepilin signal peptidase PulO-like enzyme (type II secretory pathway)